MNNNLSRSSPFYHPLSAAIILLLAGLLIYGNILSAPFVFDDDGIIVDNHQIMINDFKLSMLADLFKAPSPNRPFAKLTFILNYKAHKLDVTGYHLVNLLTHVINAWLVFYLLQLTLHRPGQGLSLAPLLAGLLWLTLPVHIQSVTYIVKRMNIMAAMFYLLAIICYIHARENQTRKGRAGVTIILLLGCGMAGMLGLLTKETTITLPVFIFLYEWFFFQNLNRAWLKKHLRQLGIITASCTLIAVIYLGGHPLEKIAETYGNRPFTPDQRILTQPRVVIYFLSLLAWPHPDRFTLDYDFPMSYGFTDPAVNLLALTALAALLVMAVFSARGNRLLSFSLLWFLGNLIIESSIIGLPLIFEHRTYLPSILPVMAGSIVLFKYVQPAKTAVLLLCAMITVSGLWTWQRNCLWKDNLTLFQDSANKAPDNPRVCHNLGLALERAGDYHQAIRFFRKSLDLESERPKSSPSKIAQIHNSLGTAFLKAELYQEAITHFQTALQIMTATSPPDSLDIADIHNNLGIGYNKTDNIKQAFSHTREALAIRVSIAGQHSLDCAESLNNLGLIYNHKEDYSQAATYFQEALTIFKDKLGDDDARTATFYSNLGMTEFHRHNTLLAIKYFKKAMVIRIKTSGPGHPDTARVYFNLGAAYQNMKDYHLATVFYKQALMVFRNRFGDNHPVTRKTMNKLSALGPEVESQKQKGQRGHPGR